MSIYNKTKILILSQTSGEIINELAAELSSNFGKTVFITGTKFKKKYKNLTIIDAPKYSNHSYLSRFKTWTHYLLFTFLELRKFTDHPILIISSNPPFLPYLGYIFKKKNNWNYLVRILDIYPDALVQKKLIKESSYIFKTWALFNKKIYDNAEIVITLGKVMAKNASNYLSKPNNISIIPDWVDTKNFKPIPPDKNWFLKKNFDKNKINVIYSGNLGLTHSTSLIFNGIKKIKNNNISFTIIGGGASREKIINQSKKLKNLNYLPFQPQEHLPSLLASADIAIVCLGEGTQGISMPSKLYSSMACGSAILSISNGENDLRYIVEKSKCGINVDNNDLDGFVEAINIFFSNPAYLKSCKNNSRSFLEKNFSGKKIIPKYIDLIKNINKRK